MGAAEDGWGGTGMGIGEGEGVGTAEEGELLLFALLLLLLGLKEANRFWAELFLLIVGRWFVGAVFVADGPGCDSILGEAA